MVDRVLNAGILPTDIIITMTNVERNIIVDAAVATVITITFNSRLRAPQHSSV